MPQERAKLRERAVQRRKENALATYADEDCGEVGEESRHVEAVVLEDEVRRRKQSLVHRALLCTVHLL